MLLKNKRKPQKAPFAGPAVVMRLRVRTPKGICTSGRKACEAQPEPPALRTFRSEAARRPGASAAPAEGQDAKRVSASVQCGPRAKIRISKMPKMKTKSGAKKRFKMTGTGKVVAAQAGKRHGMIKRTAKFIQKARGTNVLNDSDAKIVKKYMPYNR
jgi:large subunit ribosomal protein L35